MTVVSETPKKFRIVFDCVVEITDELALRAAQDFETLSAEGELSLAMPPDVNWMLASTLAQHEILALNQSERGVRFVAAAAIPRFPKATGGYDAVELPAYPA
jgi:hypothetical protein